MAEQAFDFTNLPQFLRIVDGIVTALPREVVDKAAGDVARDWISAARNKASGTYSGRAAGAFSVGKDANGAVIHNSDPGFYGQEFGGRSRPETMMFPPHQGQRGYFFFPAGRENTDRFQRVWESAIDNATKGWK